jgi:hypothetical protein
MQRFVRPLYLITSITAACTVLACSKKATTPTQPTPPPPTAVTIAAPVLKGPVGGAVTDSLHPTLEVTNAVTTGTAGTITYAFQASELDSFPDDSHTFQATDVAQGSGSTSVTVGPSQLIPNFPYFWRARATNGTITSDWSKVDTFKTANMAFRNGTDIYDPLTTGASVGTVVGGRFIPGVGWQSMSITDGVQYDIPTCSSCRAEFDVTGFGKREGEALQKDLKWFTMGDASTWPSFGAFRDSPWKMHLEQRSDAGNGMKLIWRNGGNGGGDPGDHTQRNDNTEDWNGNTVYHFVFDWNPGGFSISVNGHTWFTGGFARPYEPPNHRIELGCSPRGESFVNSATFSNFRLTPH